MSDRATSTPRHGELARSHELGEFVQRHGAFKEATRVSVWYALGGLGMMAYAVFGHTAGFEMPGWSLALIFGVGLLLAAFGSFSLVRLLSQELELYQGGIVHRRLGGLEVIPYRDLLGVLIDVTTTRHVQSGTSSRHGKIVLVVRAAGGQSRRVELRPDFEDIESLANTFLAAAGEHVVTNALAELGAGRSIDCGAFYLTPRGVEADGKLLAHSTGLRAWVDSTHVSVKGGKQELRFLKSRVINAAFLETLLRALDPRHRERLELSYGQSGEPARDAGAAKAPTAGE